MIGKYIFITLVLLLADNAGADDRRIASSVYAWADLAVERSESRERRPVFRGSTAGFEYLQVHASTVAPGAAAHDPHSHDDREELVIVKEGTMELTVNGEGRALPSGSVSLVLPGDSHGMRNAGDDPATYYVIRWRTRAPKAAADPGAVSVTANWDELEFRETPKGGRRSIMRVPTAMLAEFEIHTTMLSPGMQSHEPHTHVEDEIILVRYGQVEETIDGVAHPAGPGDVIFLEASGSHGIRNSGEGPCEYYAFKWRLP